MSYADNNIYFGVYETDNNAEGTSPRIKTHKNLKYEKQSIFCFFLKAPSKVSLKKRNHSNTENDLFHKLSDQNIIHVYGECSKLCWMRFSGVLNSIISIQNTKMLRYICNNANGIDPYTVNSIYKKFKLHSAQSMEKETIYEFFNTEFIEKNETSTSGTFKNESDRSKVNFYSLNRIETAIFINHFHK